MGETLKGRGGEAEGSYDELRSEATTSEGDGRSGGCARLVVEECGCWAVESSVIEEDEAAGWWSSVGEIRGRSPESGRGVEEEEPPRREGQCSRQCR